HVAKEIDDASAQEHKEHAVDARVAQEGASQRAPEQHREYRDPDEKPGHPQQKAARVVHAARPSARKIAGAFTDPQESHPSNAQPRTLTGWSAKLARPSYHDKEIPRLPRSLGQTQPAAGPPRNASRISAARGG